MLPQRSIVKTLKLFALSFCLTHSFGCSNGNLLVSHPITVVTAIDQSESARNNGHYNTALQDVCHLQSDLAQDGDMMLTILFAEETQVVDKTTIANQLEALQICKRQEEQRQQSQIGKAPGTSIHKVVERIAQQMNRLAQQPDHTSASLLILMIHANETGTSPEEFAVTAAKLKQLAQHQTSIVIIVGDAELGRLLDRYLLDLPIDVCPANDPIDCIRQSYEVARRAVQQN